MAYDGHWRESLEFIARAYKENSSVRSAIEGERNIQGFFTAYLSVNAYYLIAPEVELNHGYCDLFLMPDLLRYKVKHSYILELICRCPEGTAIDTRHGITLHRDAIPRLRVGADGESSVTPPYYPRFHRFGRTTIHPCLSYSPFPLLTPIDLQPITEMGLLFPEMGLHLFT